MLLKMKQLANFDKLDAYKQLQAIMPNVLKNIDLEKLKTMELNDILKIIQQG